MAQAFVETANLVTHPAAVTAPSLLNRARRPSRSSASRRKAFDFGVESERSVAFFLRAGGYDVLGRRARERSAEVDLIVVRDDTVAFVEVKARRNGWDGLEAVGRAKQKRLSRAANEWLARNAQYASHTIRFDVALVSRDASIEYLENAFDEVPCDEFTW